ncbi:MAG: SusC/RagA family TonB-linked outer membrane protein [Bacteroidales bacterium]|nr:SusC/RagA family TonB-linked outer membrane protein [Bacteroidales bacterium]
MKNIIDKYVNFREIIVSSKKLLAMRFTFLFILLSFFKVSANYSQDFLTLKMENTSIRSILKEIERQTDYTFLYDNAKVDVNQQKTMSLENKAIETVLDELFAGTQIAYRIKSKQIVLGNKGESFMLQKLLITGKVTSSDENEPLPGVNIMVKGTTTGTVTDLNGNYQIEVPDENAILVFQYIGYLTEEIIVGTNRNIDVTLTMDILSLSEVVVVGYGTMRKQDLTGSITSVSADDLHKGVITTTEQMLQGKVAGLTVIKGSGDPTEGATMRLRGGTSLSASSSPLVVVDGIPGVDINTIQPSDIVSIDVLKDASSAAIYGSRGANGVIIITTSKPGKGKHIEYSNYVAFAKPSNYIDMLSADEWRQKVEEYEKTAAIDYGGNTDWQKEIVQKSVSQSHTISFSSSNEDGGYRASLTYMDNQGVIKTSYLQRLGASLSGHTYGLNKKLKLDFGIHSTFDNYTPIDNYVFERTYNVNPTAPVFDSTGAYFQTNDNLAENPVEMLENLNNDQTNKRFLGYAKAELEILPGLKGIVNTSMIYGSHQGRYYLPINRFRSTDHGYANRSLGDYNTQQIETYLNYDKEFAGMHRVNLMGGYSYLDNTYEGFFAQRRYFDTDMFLYNSLGAGIDYRTDDVSSYKGNSKLISFFGRANYSFNGRYIITATLRQDGSSRFGGNNKWGLFPSVAGAWKISDEAFMASSQNWLNHLKLRAGYGVTGSQDAIGEYKSLALLGTVGGKYYDPVTQTWKASYSPIQNPNPDLKWESTTQTNIGIDISVFNRLSATIDLYKKVTNDLLFTYAVPIPPNLFHETLANVGDLSNKGIEITFDYTVIQQKDLQWNINLSLARNNMVIEKLSNDIYTTEAVPTGSLHGLPGMSNQYSQTIREGYAVGTFWGEECTGLNENGKFIDVNGKVLTMSPNDTLNKDLGNAQPKLNLGISTGLTFKGFDLSISTYGLFGQKVLNATAMSLNTMNRFPGLNVPDRVFADSITSNTTFSSYWIEDASFFRLQSLTLGYTVNINKAGIDKLRVYATGENLFVITGYSGLDPEIRLESYNAAEGKMDPLSSPGIDRFNVYPRPRTLTFGLNLTF